MGIGSRQSAVRGRVVVAWFLDLWACMAQPCNAFCDLHATAFFCSSCVVFGEHTKNAHNYVHHDPIGEGKGCDRLTVYAHPCRILDSEYTRQKNLPTVYTTSIVYYVVNVA